MEVVAGGAQTVRGFAPLAEMFQYATALRSKTKGRGTYTLQFSHYEQLPQAIAEKMIGK